MSEDLSKRPLRWGICGSGNIAFDFVNALQSFPKDQHVVHAVGDMERFKENAEKFGAEFGIPTVYSSFEALADDPLVDVAYVGVVNAMHFPVASLLLRKKKNVIVEKPLSCCSRLVEELLALAKENDVFFMEVHIYVDCGAWLHFNFACFSCIWKSLLGPPTALTVASDMLSLELDPTCPSAIYLWHHDVTVMNNQRTGGSSSRDYASPSISPSHLTADHSPIH